MRLSRHLPDKVHPSSPILIIVDAPHTDYTLGPGTNARPRHSKLLCRTDTSRRTQPSTRKLPQDGVTNSHTRYLSCNRSAGRLRGHLICINKRRHGKGSRR